jgi:hypothetical protein
MQNILPKKSKKFHPKIELGKMKRRTIYFSEELIILYK